MNREHKTANLGPLLTLLLCALCAGFAQADQSVPDLEYFHTDGIPLDGYDAPAICNHWLWAQAGTGKHNGLLDMEDIRAGAAPQFSGTVVVKLNGNPLVPNPGSAEWWPNKVTRHAAVDGLHFQGTVVAAREKHALLDRLVVSNATANPAVFSLELSFDPSHGQYGVVEQPASIAKAGQENVCRFESVHLAAGACWTVRAVHVYRGTEQQRDQLLANFDEEWRASDEYWNGLLRDAYTPGAGPFLSGGAPRLVTRDSAAQRFYNFGVVTALMLLKRDPDKPTPANLYVTAMPDEAYGTTSYIWDISYASELLALMDPEALRTMIERWALADPHTILSVPYQEVKPTSGDLFYASNGSMFFFSVWNYVNYTGNYAWLDQNVGGRTLLQHLRAVADWHKTRPQWQGLAHYGEEANLFDDITVPGYQHYVAAPNAADVWMNRALADLYEKLHHDTATAASLRAEAARIAVALNKHLYNSEGDHSGTWKQHHSDGSEAHLRHSWDFMCAATFMTQDLKKGQKQAMRDWFMQNLVRAGSADKWVVAQDPRDGNNGPHQQEHNGRGAYPAWPYHDGWALHAMGYQKDVLELLRITQRITGMGAIGQGYAPSGHRCRSNWANVAGASAAAYLLHNVFDVWPGLGPFQPHPELGQFDPKAHFDNVSVAGKLHRIDASGAHPMTTKQD